MTYLPGLVSGMAVTVVGVLLTLLSQYLSYEYNSPDYFSNSILLSVEKGRMNQTEAEGYFTLMRAISEFLIFAGAMGLITTSVVLLFLRAGA